MKQDRNLENFRLISGFNDIFIALAAILLLVGIVIVGNPLNSMVQAFLIVLVSAGLAEYFTRNQKLALTSIVLVVAFAIAVVWGIDRVFTTVFLDTPIQPPVNTDTLYVASPAPLYLVTLPLTFLLSSLAVLGYWFRYRTPISIAIATGLVLILLLYVYLVLFPLGSGAAKGVAGYDVPSVTIGMGTLIVANHLMGLLFLLGLATLVLAMYFDWRDKSRESDMSDIAFWLHILAAPLIVHPIYSLLDILDDPSTIGALLATFLYVILALLAVIVNRRAVLVAGAGYLIAAIGVYFDQLFSTTISIGISLILIGAILLVLAVWWVPFREAMLQWMPSSLRDLLP